MKSRRKFSAEFKARVAFEAINEFYLALMIDPNFTYSLNKLHEIYKKTGREDKAQNILLLIENANQGKQNDPQTINNILTSP